METPTHTAYLLIPDGQSARWREVGSAWRDAQDNTFKIQLDRVPFDAAKFTGYIQILPIGSTPAAPDAKELRHLALASDLASWTPA